MGTHFFHFGDLSYPRALVQVVGALVDLAYSRDCTASVLALTVGADGFWIERADDADSAGRFGSELFPILHRDFAEYADLAIEMLNFAEDTRRGDPPDLPFLHDFPFDNPMESNSYDAH